MLPSDSCIGSHLRPIALMNGRKHSSHSWMPRVFPEPMRVSPCSGYTPWNCTTCERDHFGDARLSLREGLAQDAAAGPANFLLTHLRYLGYIFNSMSFYYCYDAVENLESFMAESD